MSNHRNGAGRHKAKQSAEPHKPTIADRTTAPTETTASDNWKIGNDVFRRLAHTGEFSSPDEDKPAGSETKSD